ncbi:hypothetical protein K2173_004863 [Erythroxylum novogranatense]|uniref:Reverse transcriptase Ty1/copia-type domain-containing protein n=1 Tax=Erythroxylum novogranatense TaxID=1862640 RepID=A0AAV8TAW3_9ROSI|nr:hypothetical protein K2173_004863 [Erythroxylum novogranatense]
MVFCLTNALQHFRFRGSKGDSSLFIYSSNGENAYCLVYVDDLILTGSSTELLHRLIIQLGRSVTLKDLGPLTYFLGVEVSWISDGLQLTQSKYIKDLLHRANMQDASSVSTPSTPQSDLTGTTSEAFEDPTLYRQIVGGLQYLALTRPDVTMTVNKADRKNTSAYIVFHGSNPISWVSRKQRTVARSSTDSEYRALAAAASEVYWLQCLLRELNYTLPTTPRVWCDNVSATYLAANPVFHSLVSYISTVDQLADALTKPLSKPRFLLMRDKLMVLFPIGFRGVLRI